jgi:carbonic anhydrase/acetyltransferase-like protein (isoleucine patch superfamily)
VQFQLQERRVQCHGNNFIAPSATLIGAVTLENEASVWFNAVLRGDNDAITIGEGSNVQDGSVVHIDPGLPLVVGRDCTVGHLVMLHGCTIGEGCLIGIKSVIMNGARIGKNCLVGAGSLVTEGKEFPDRSLILGTPAKVVRQLTDDEVQGVLRSARHYVALARRYMQGLQPQQ